MHGQIIVNSSKHIFVHACVITFQTNMTQEGTLRLCQQGGVVVAEVDPRSMFW